MNEVVGKNVERIELRDDTAGNWTTKNPVLGQGEVGVQRGATPVFKIGDGVTPWNALPYVESGGSGGSSQLFALLGIAKSTPGAAATSMISADLATVKPAVALFDATHLFNGYGCLAENGGTIVAGCRPAAPGTFIGHTLNLLYRSIDDGATWTGAVTPLDGSISAGSLAVTTVLALGAGVWYALVYDGAVSQVLRSTNDGVTWATVTTTPPSIDGFLDMLAYDGTYFYVTGSNSSIPALWRTTNFSSWTSLDDGLSAPPGAVVATPTVLLAWSLQSGVGLNLAVSHDHGATFTRPVDPTAQAPYIYQLWTDGEGHWLAWGPNSVIQSFDNGDTWVNDLVAFPAFVTMVASGFLPGVGWVSTWGPCTADGQGYIVYSAPVATPLVWTPTAYAASNVQPPVGTLIVLN